MPTARQVSVTKKQKLQEDEESAAAVRAEDSVTFATLIDREYPNELIAENLLRMLNYDSLQGLGELLSLLVRSAGCLAEFTLMAGPSDAEVGAIADQIEASCLRAPQGCPATFPFQKLEFSKRVAQLLETVVASMRDAGDRTVLALAAKLVAKLTTVTLQSLRLVATGFAGIVMNALHVDGEDSEAAAAREGLASAVAARTGDVSAAIRRRAVSDIVFTRPSETVRALNDTNGSVRLAAVRALGSGVDTQELQADQDIGSALIKRLEEIAVRDVDLPVRKAALRYLHAENHLIEDSGMFSHMLQDDDEPSRRMAAELIVKREAHNASSAQLLVLAVSELNTSPLVASALAHGLERVKTLYHVHWAEQIAIMLTSDYDKDSRKPKLAAPLKQQYKLLAKQLSDGHVRLKTTSLLEAVLAAAKSETSSAFLPYVPALLQRAQHSDELLSGCLAALSNLNFDSLMAHSDSASLSIRAFDLVRDVFMDRSNGRRVVEAIGKFFASIPESSRTRLLKDVHQDLRLKLASILGTSGTLRRDRSDALKIVVLQSIVIGRFIDISDLLKLPLWKALSEGNVHILQLVRAIGMKGDVDTIKLTVKHLSERRCGPAVDDILRIFVSAKMRGIELDMPLPLDINGTAPTSESAWRAAVAASVI